MLPQKKSKKNTPTEADQEDHHAVEDNGIPLTTEPSQITDLEWIAKLEALQRARAEKTAQALEPFAEEESDEDDDQAIDRELERVNQQVLQLPKEKKRFANQLQARRKASEKLEKLNQAKEQRERMQREIDKMKEQENNSLWRDSPHRKSGQNRRTSRENFFAGIGTRNSQMQTHHSHLGCKQHHGHQSTRQYLYRSTMGMETLDSS
jgi:hypothetical protein